MNKTELLIRQQLLVQKSTLLRTQLKAQSAVLVKPLQVLDQGKLALKWLSDHPVWPLSALLLVVLLKPGTLGGRIWRGYKAYLAFKALLPKTRAK